jgi:hypothetical protein
MKLISHRLISAWVLTALLLCLTACASIPAPPPKKVQTYEELFLKLKEGFYSGRLMEEEFYAKELGYPLKTPLRYLPNDVKDLERSQTLTLDTENFKLSDLVVSSTATNGRKIVYVRFGSGDTQSCLKESEFLRIWEPKNLTVGRDPAFHRRYAPGIVPVVIAFWSANHSKNTMQMNASFEASGLPKCLHHASFSISSIKE